MKDFYLILGVDRGADARAIRSAYLNLIKRFHPDRSRPGDRGEALARDINLAFSVLRDDARRSQYDLDLSAYERALEEQRAAARRRSRALMVVPQHRARARGVRTGRILLALAVLGSISFLYDRDLKTLTDPPTLQIGWGGEEAAPGLPTLPPLDTGIVDDAVADYEWISVASGMVGLNTHSEQCWRMMRRQPSFSLLSRCAAFDAAAEVFVNGAPGSATRAAASHFSAAARAQRYRRGLGQVAKGVDPTPSLKLVESAAIAAMVDRLGRRRGRNPEPS